MNLLNKTSKQIMSGDAVSSHHEVHPNYLVATSGLKSWLLTVDHKRIGVMYFLGISLFFLVAGFFALLLRTELLLPRIPNATATSYFISADHF